MDTAKGLNTISFFTGYGGIERGIELTGERVVHLASCEIEAYSQANLIKEMEAGRLASHPIWTDAKTFPGEQFLGKVDLFTGGFPCQPFSSAGSRNADDDPRHLFPSCLRAIESFKPVRVFLENVEGLISAKLGGDGWSDPKGTPVLIHVLRELERRGYKTAWGVFSASEAGAPHQRKRVFILGELANSQHYGYNAAQESGGSRQEPKKGGMLKPEGVDSSRGNISVRGTEELANSSDLLCYGCLDKPRELTESQSPSEFGDNSGQGGVQELANPIVKGLQSGRSSEGLDTEGWQKQTRHSTKCGHIWPTRPGQHQGSMEEPRTQPKLGRTINGASHRVERLRMLGNGVVPQTAAIAWITLNERMGNE